MPAAGLSIASQKLSFHYDFFAAAVTELIKPLTIGVVGVFTQSVAIVVVICSTAGQEGHEESREENMRRNNYTFYHRKESLKDIAHALRKVSIHVAVTTEVLLVY